MLYHNNGNNNHWLEFRLVGTRSNRSAIGAKVRVRATISGQILWQMREISGGDGLRGQNSLHVHVGLGNATIADLVRIEWPSGTVQELPNIPANQFLTITGLNFADGHSEIRRWRDARTTPPKGKAGGRGFLNPALSPNNEDSYWLGVRTTGLPVILFITPMLCTALLGASGSTCAKGMSA